MATTVEVKPLENGITKETTPPLKEIQVEQVNSDDDSQVRKHTNTSVSRTNQNPLTNGGNKMEDIKQKIDFTTSELPDDDNQSHHSGYSDNSNASSNNEDEGEVSRLKSSASPSLNNSVMEREEEISEDMLATASSDVHEEKTTVETIVERLNAVRSYTEDARAVYEQLQLHEHEPGNLEQMERVSMLITQLKQQELSYLQVLLKLMESQGVDDDELNQLEVMVNNRSTVEDEEEVDYVSDQEDDEEEEDNSMSLKAEISKNKSKSKKNDDSSSREGVSDELEEQREEIQALHEQRTLLLKLQEQQTQLKALQMKQAKLLQLKKDAEERLSAAEKKFDELGDDSREQSLLMDNEPPVTDRERMLMEELAELKRRKIIAETMMTAMSPPPADGDNSISPRSATKPVTTEHHDNSKDELVDSDLQNLHSRMKQVEEARQKMKELQQMVEMLQIMNNDNRSDEEVLVAKPQQQKRKGTQVKPRWEDSNESQDDEVIHLLANYERDISKRQRELEDVMKRKEELKRVEGMLQDLKLVTEGRSTTVHTSNKHDDDDDEVIEEVDHCVDPNDDGHEVEVSEGLANELTKQQELYSDLKRKTQQLKQLQQEIEKLSRGSDLDSAVADTTIATWGGSSIDSIQSTGQDEDPTTGGGDHRNNDNLPQYQVDRHTPRNPRPLRRAYSPHDEQDQTTIGKKIKLEPPSGGSMGDTPKSKKTVGSGNSSTVTPSVNKRSAVWPSVIFSQSNGKTANAAKVQTPPTFSCPKVTPHSSKVPPNMGVADDYTSLLQQQLGNSSAMCFQLMEQQSSLIQALNQKLDTLPHIHQQMIQLHEYHDHLQGYHEYLNNAYWQILECANPESSGEVGGVKKTDDGNHDNEEKEARVTLRPTSFKLSRSLLEDPLYPPPQPPQPSINSPFPRPSNPHLQTSPSTKQPRPLSRPPGYPYSLFGSHVGRDIPDKQNQETQYEANESSKDAAAMNSLEVDSSSSLPDRIIPNSASEGGAVFQKLRDTIYSEVATLIASNEHRPHFLVDLFRELQLLNTDYLRQRALFAIQDLIAKFLKLENDLNQEEETTTNDDDAPVNNDPSVYVAKRGNSQRFDYTENADSASSISTPPIPDEPPFASDVLGDTVVKMTKVEPTLSASNEFELDTSELDEEVKLIMTNVIPLLKSHLSETCSEELLGVVKSAVIDQVTANTSIKIEGDLGSIFIEQLHTSLSTVAEKYQDKILKECGEDFLVDISEVLFNEVAFYRLLKETQGMTGKDYYNSMTSNSQTTTDIDSITNSPQQRPVVSSLSLQALGTMISKTLQEESESLGNRRDDDLAQAWEPDTDTPNKPSEEGGDEVISIPSVEDNNEIQQVEVREEGMIENGYVNLITTEEATPTFQVSPPKGQDESKVASSDQST